MSDDTTSFGFDRTDFTDSNMITDFTQVVSCAVGRSRVEAQRERIREELVREHLDEDAIVISAPAFRKRRLFNLS